MKDQAKIDETKAEVQVDEAGKMRLNDLIKEQIAAQGFKDISKEKVYIDGLLDGLSIAKRFMKEVEG